MEPLISGRFARARPLRGTLDQNRGVTHHDADGAGAVQVQHAEVADVPGDVCLAAAAQVAGDAAGIPDRHGGAGRVVDSPVADAAAERAGPVLGQDAVVDCQGPRAVVDAAAVAAEPVVAGTGEVAG